MSEISDPIRPGLTARTSPRATPPDGKADTPGQEDGAQDAFAETLDTLVALVESAPDNAPATGRERSADAPPARRTATVPGTLNRILELRARSGDGQPLPEGETAPAVPPSTERGVTGSAPAGPVAATGGLSATAVSLDVAAPPDPAAAPPAGQKTAEETPPAIRASTAPETAGPAGTGAAKPAESAPGRAADPAPRDPAARTAPEAMRISAEEARPRVSATDAPAAPTPVAGPALVASRPAAQVVSTPKPAAQIPVDAADGTSLDPALRPDGTEATHRPAAADAAVAAIRGASGPGSPPAPVISQVVAPLAARAERGEGGELTLRLDPPELGSVRISFSGLESQLTALVQADRPEIEALLRRNADILATALAEAGFEGATLAFADRDAGGADDRKPPPDGAVTADRPATDTPGPDAGPRAVSASGLDLRL